MTEEDHKTCLEMATAIDEMPRSLSTDNAEFLDRILKKLKAREKLEPREKGRLEKLYSRYFTEDDVEREEEPQESEESEEIDDDDFA